MFLKKDVWEKAVRITSMYEGWISGNYDGMYLSYGYLQWNLGQGTLQPLFSRLFKEFSEAAKILPGAGISLKNALANRTEKAWALSIQQNSKVVEPWLTGLRNLYTTTEWHQIMDDAAVYYKNKAITMCQKFGLRTDRAFCLMFDIAVQCGSVKNPPANPTLQNIVDAVCQQVNPRWANDVRNRKMAIVNGRNMGRGWAGVTFNDMDAFDVSIVVNGKYLNVSPIIIDGHTYAPVRAIADALGKKTSWDAETKTVSIN